MNEVLTYLTHYVSTNWQTILTYLAGGAGVSAVAEVWIRIRKHDKAVWKELTVGFFSTVSALTDWIVNNYATSPLASLGNIGPRIFVAAVAMHRLLVNPSFKLVEDKVLFYLKAGKYYKEELVKETAQGQQTPAPADSPTGFVS